MGKVLLSVFFFLTSLWSNAQQLEEPRLVENYASLESIDEVYERFKGRYLLVDVWATWCKPCVETFQYKEKLTDFLNKKDVDILYLSLDRNRDDGHWRKTLEEYELNGWHLRTSNELYTSVLSTYGKKGALYIPMYLVVNTEGKVVKKIRSSTPANHTFYKKINRAIKKN